MDPNQINFTVFRFVVSLSFFLLSFAGIFVTLGKLLNKQKSHCGSIKIVNNALWEKGRPLLQSVETCKEERNEFKIVCDEILKKLEHMDTKQDKINNERSKQIENVRLHMQRVDVWYAETHKTGL